MPEQDGKWHADKRIPLALILALIVQTAGVAWWAATMDANVKTLSSRQVDNRQSISENSRAISNLSEARAATHQRLTSIEASQRRSEETLAEILRYLRENPR